MSSGKLPWDMMDTVTQVHPEWNNGQDRYCDARRYLTTSSATKGWTAGGTHEVGWTIHTNHKGSIGFRLCPLETVMANHDIGREGATESCFQAHHLEFAQTHTCIQCP